jgi:energy-coupling factor transport system ATP-binding protein
LEIYQVQNLTFTYPTRETPALCGIDLAIGRGEFVTLCGPSGCGKTTLLRLLKPSAAPFGEKAGAILFEGTPLGDLPARDAAAKIGFVLQSPENQIVTDKVWHELAFGLESLGLKTPEIRLRVAEMASFFGIQAWFHKPVTELSGGQKQLLALASIMALRPSVLILDEPTSQLDPIAAGEFLAIVGKINRELGVTVILTEHRLEEAFPLSTRALVMDKGRLIADGAPREAGLALRGQDHGMFLAMPTPMRVWGACDSGGDCPVTVRDGAVWLAGQSPDKDAIPIEASSGIHKSAKPAVELDEVWFKYEKGLPDVIKGLSFRAYFGEITAILGGNGTGKTTALSLIAGINTPYRGSIRTDASTYTLPQNPQALFVAKTVREDLLEMLSDQKLPKETKARRLAAMVKLCRLDGLLDNHPYDLSGGEQQRAALAKVLLLQPNILLLDEPTKGLDAEFKQIFAAVLRRLTTAGVAVVMVSHDVEFCAEHADRCALFFDGGIVTENTPRAFFAGNSFYTTSANRMARGILPEAVTVGDIVLALGGRMPPAPEPIDMDAKYEIDPPPSGMSGETEALSAPRKAAVGFLLLCLLATVVFTAFHIDGFMAFIGGGSEAVSIAAEGAWLYIGIMLAWSSEVGVLAFVLAYRRERREGPAKVREATAPGAGPTKGKLSKRTMVAAAMILLAIPLTIYIGSYFFGDRRYYFISLLIILETILPFALVFEGRKPQAREIVIIAVLMALAIAGRAAFFMLPQFKPLIALVIIAGVAFGGESGFLVGAAAGLVSNVFFGQGPWTPWQMFSLGVIGFLAGVLFRKGLLRRTPASLAVYGAFAAVAIYGGIMNAAQVIMYQATPVKAMFLAAYLQGIPFDLVHAAATVMFLSMISRPMLEKLDRLKIKYGLVN